MKIQLLFYILYMLHILFICIAMNICKCSTANNYKICGDKKLCVDAMFLLCDVLTQLSIWNQGNVWSICAASVSKYVTVINPGKIFFSLKADYNSVFITVSEKCGTSLLLGLQYRTIDMEIFGSNFYYIHIDMLAKCISFCPLTGKTVLY